MKDVMKKIIWVVIFCAILVGIYYVLPEYPQSFVKSTIQTVTDGAAKGRIAQIKALTNPDVSYASYEAILEGKTKTNCWLYVAADESTDGNEHVIFYGRGAALNLKDFPEFEGLLYTSASVKVDFAIVGKNVEIYPYIDGKAMFFDKSVKNYKKSNDAVKLSIMSQLYSGAISTQ